MGTHQPDMGDIVMPEAPAPAAAPTPGQSAPAAPAATQTPAPAAPQAAQAPAAPKPSAPTPKVAVNEHGFPDKTPVADMAPEHQAAYWRHQSKRHESRSLKALGFTDEQIDQIVALRKENPGVVAEKVAGFDDLAKRIAELEKDRDAARAEAEVARAVATYRVSAEDAALLNGLSGDVLTSLAKRLGGGATLPAAPSTDGAGKVGAPVSGPRQIATREEYAALSPEERRAARRDGRLNQLLGITG